MKCSKTSWYTAVLTLDLRKHSGPTQQMTWHPKPSLTVETLHWTSSNVDSVPLLSSSRLWDPDFQGNAKFTFSREHNFGPLSSSPGETLLMLSVVQEWLDTRNATAETHVLHTSVRSGFEALTPAAVHSLWISPTFLNGFCFTILSRVRLSLLLVHFFFYHSFPSLRLSINVLGHRALWTASLFCNDICVLPSLCKVSMVVFWTTVKSAVFPMIV